MVKTINTRIQLKSDTEEHWRSAVLITDNEQGTKESTGGAKSFVPRNGEAIIFEADADHNYPRLKIGNGVLDVLSLPFVDAGTVNGHTINIDVPSNAVFTDTTYTGVDGIRINNDNEIGHVNSITASDLTKEVYKITYDEQGHITGAEKVEVGTVTSVQVQALDPLQSSSSSASSTTLNTTISFKSVDSHQVLIGPAQEGGAAAPSFRNLISDDIPYLSADKINSGTLDAARIPALSANKITSDTLNPDRIPNINLANKIDGVLPISHGGTGRNGSAENDSFKNGEVFLYNSTSNRFDQIGITHLANGETFAHYLAEGGENNTAPSDSLLVNLELLRTAVPPINLKNVADTTSNSYRLSYYAPVSKGRINSVLISVADANNAHNSDSETDQASVEQIPIWLDPNNLAGADNSGPGGALYFGRDEEAETTSLNKPFKTQWGTLPVEQGGTGHYEFPTYEGGSVLLGYGKQSLTTIRKSTSHINGTSTLVERTDAGDFSTNKITLTSGIDASFRSNSEEQEETVTSNVITIANGSVTLHGNLDADDLNASIGILNMIRSDHEVAEQPIMNWYKSTKSGTTITNTKLGEIYWDVTNGRGVLTNIHTPLDTARIDSYYLPPTDSASDKDNTFTFLATADTISGVLSPNSILFSPSGKYNQISAILNTAGAFYSDGNNSPGYGILPTIYGGTGTNFFTAKAILYGNGSNTIQAEIPEWKAWVAGTTAGPQAVFHIGNADYTSAAIPAASTGTSGIVTNTDQSFAGIKTFTSQVILNNTTDISGTAASESALIIGTKTGYHLAFDADEIMAKSNATTPSGLYLNYNGGNVVIGLNDNNYNVAIRSTLDSSGKTTGALVVGGGAGFSGTVYANGFNGPLTGHASLDLPLTGGIVTGYISLKTNYNASLANNGISSGIGYPTTFNILDSAERIMVRKEAVINSNGSIGSYWYVRNYNTEGTLVTQKGIGMYMAKDGTLTYGVSDPAAFKSALGLGTVDMNFQASTYNGTNQHWGIGAVVQATSQGTKAYLNKRTSLVVTDIGCFLYNNTDNATIWSCVPSSYLPLAGGTMTGSIHFSKDSPLIFNYTGSTEMPVLVLNNAPNYGIRYTEGTPDTMKFSASGNANTNNADLCINGAGDGTVTIRGNTILHAGNYTSYAMRYINTTDATTWTADTLSATNSIAFTRANITGAYDTGHIVWLNAATIGTPFQLVVHDSSSLYFYKRWKSSGTWSAWTKMNAGYADSAGSVAWTNITSNPGIYANDVTSYGNVKLTTAKGGYYGITFGTSKSNMIAMSSGQHNGLFVESKRWVFYYDSTNDRASIGDSSPVAGYILKVAGSEYVNGSLLTTSNITATNGGVFRIDHTGQGAKTTGTAYSAFYLAFKNSANNATYATEPIRYVGTDGTDTYNTCVILGSNNGTTWVGAGESSNYMPGKIAYNDESLYLSSDGFVKIYTNCANDASSYQGPITISGTTITANLSGNATTASALTNITTADGASSSADWRRIWISYANNTTGRPAYTDNFTYQTSTNTLRLVGPIAYKGTKNTYNMIKFKDNPDDTSGNGIIIGGGGLVCIGGGESADNVSNGLSGNGGAEQLCLSNDAAIDFYTNCQGGFSSAVHTSISTTGTYTHEDSAVSYVAGSKGDHAALYAKKAYNQDHWYPAVALETKGGGAWQIGNYNNENLNFAYVTKANRDSNTNTVSVLSLEAASGTIVTSANYTSYTVTKTGSGASGTWGINVTGKAANVTGTVGITNGGTGATAPQEARQNLGFRAGAYTFGKFTAAGSTQTATITFSGTMNRVVTAVTATIRDDSLNKAKAMWVTTSNFDYDTNTKVGTFNLHLHSTITTATNTIVTWIAME